MILDFQLYIDNDHLEANTVTVVDRTEQALVLDSFPACRIR